MIGMAGELSNLRIPQDNGLEALEQKITRMSGKKDSSHSSGRNPVGNNSESGCKIFNIAQDELEARLEKEVEFYAA